jgi:hypothetical protein
VENGGGGGSGIVVGQCCRFSSWWRMTKT